MHVPIDHLLLVLTGGGSRLTRDVAWGRPRGHPAGALSRLADVTMTPDPGQLPGGSTLQQLTDGVGGWALILSLVGMVVGAAAWALGSHSQNYQQSFIGRRTVLISGLAALVIGAAPAIVNFFFHAGQGVH
ncbi:MAG TPA: DUF6112 family protein [Acidimicrobiales bacterium]|nr:DUF6112 family protein [Acidimicrobiales bacterium]